MKNILYLFIAIFISSCSVSKPLLTDAQLVENFVTEMKTAIKNKNIKAVKQRIAFLSSEIDANDLTELATKKRDAKISKEEFLKKVNSDLEETFGKITKTLNKNYKFVEVEKKEVSDKSIKKILEPLKYIALYDNIFLIYSDGEKDYKVNFSGIVKKNNKLFFINGFYFGLKFR